MEILVAEDDLINQAVFHALFSAMGYPINCVANGREAVKALNAKRYDIVFMDLDMPYMDGYEATVQIRALERKHGSQPVLIVALTANAIAGVRDKCLAVGMDDFLSKPVKMGELQEKISVLLGDQTI